jgi:excisionase family DNA binding protein
MLQQEGERLDSWKEIAAYLGRDLRTVRRWEKEKRLPVHRVPGGERRAVFAYRAQIDAWLENLDGDESVSSYREAGQSASVAPAPQSVAAAPGPKAIPVAPAGLQFGRTAFLAALLTFACFAILLSFVLRSRGRALLSTDDSKPEISSVSPILPQARQRIVIQGRGFGLHVPYANTDTPYLAIRDDSARWAAGRILPHNWDEVMLNVESWTDNQIVITGFSGDYGKNGWKLTAGDKLEIAVWNPQNGVGPALYHVRVLR